MEGGSGLIGVAGDVATSAVALAGLVLVFLGTISAGFEAYEPQEKRAVVGRYQRRAWLVFVGFVLSLISALLGILGKWLSNECAALAAMVALFLGLAWVLMVAVVVIRDIK
jgi:hypothetical protein